VFLGLGVGGQFVLLGELSLGLGRRRAVSLVHGVQILKLRFGKTVEQGLHLGVGGEFVLLGGLKVGRNAIFLDVRLDSGVGRQVVFLGGLFILRGRGRAVSLVHLVQVGELGLGELVKHGLELGVGR